MKSFTRYRQKTMLCMMIVLTLLLTAACTGTAPPPASPEDGTPPAASDPVAADPTGEVQIIPLTPEQVSEQGIANDWAPASFLADQQDLVGDPLNGSPGPLKSFDKPEATNWSPGKETNKAVIDLGGKYRVTAVCLFGSNGGTDDPPAQLQHGAPTLGWTTFDETPFGEWNEEGTWYKFVTKFDATHLRIKLNGSAEAAIGEIVVYGVPFPSDPAHPEGASTGQKSVSGNTFRAFLGHNALINSTPEDINIGGIVREYHPWGWDWNGGAPKKLNFENSRMGLSFDAFYSDIHKNGMDILWCLEESEAPVDRAGIPVDPKGTPEDPLSYKEHAGLMFQFAARYGGNTQVDRSLLKLAQGETPKTGLGYIKYYEGYNEPDSTWGPNAPDYIFTPQQLAAMMSADYDGHEGRLGAGYGVKTADPGAVYVMPGMAYIDLDYLDQMRVWFEENRTDRKFAADALNYHIYTFGEEGQAGGSADSPEAGKLREQVEQITAYRDANLPGTELWITEFGWDTNPESPLDAPAHAGYTTEEVQAQWLVRGYLALAEAGVDRATMYMLADYDPKDDTQFATSGFLTYKEKSDERIYKPSWYYVKTLVRNLGGLQYARTIRSDKEAKMLAFSTPGASDTAAIVVWSPTSDGTVIRDFAIDTGEAKQARIIAFAAGSPEGSSRTVQLSGSLKLDLSESPVIILLQ